MVDQRLGARWSQSPSHVGMILPKVFPQCDVLNAHANIRRCLVAVNDPLVCPTMAGQAPRAL